VAETLQGIRNDVVDRARGEILWKRFDERVQRLETVKEAGGWALATGHAPVSLSVGSSADAQERRRLCRWL
jgi:hypothetical protein